MSATREARYLSAADLGKNISGVDNNGRLFDGPFVYMQALAGHITVWVTPDPLAAFTDHELYPTDPVTITGKQP